MAFNSMLCLSSQTLLPGGFPAMGYSRAFPPVVSTVPSVRRPGLSSELSLRIFAVSPRSINGKASDRGIEEKLARMLEKEIKETQKQVGPWISDLPVHVPFDSIEDNEGARTITLIKKYNNESIKLQAHIPEDDGEDVDEEEEEEEENSDIEMVPLDEKGDAVDDEAVDDDLDDDSIPMVVSISKENGSVLEFALTTHPDELIIDSMTIKQEDKSSDEFANYGPNFGDLEEDMQKTFYKYLEVRGVTLTTVQFLHAYIDDKMSREYLNWLKNLKSFVEK